MTRLSFLSVFRQRLFFLLCVVIFLFLAVSSGREFWRNRQIKKTIVSLELQAAELEARNLDIAKLNAELETESFLEREARLRLGLAKPGERVVIVEDGSTEPAVAQIGGEAFTEQDVIEGPVSNLGRWSWYFFQPTDFDRLRALAKAGL